MQNMSEKSGDISLLFSSPLDFSGYGILMKKKNWSRSYKHEDFLVTVSRFTKLMATSSSEH